MVDQYIDYFRSLAVRHPSIQHSAANEGLDGNPSLCHFGRFWEPDIYKKTAPEGCVSNDISLMLHLMEGKPDEGPGLYALTGIFSGGLVVSRRVVPGSIQDEQKSFSDCWQVILDLLKEFSDQSLDGCGGFARFDFNNTHWFQIGPIWDYRFGWWLKFDFTSPLDLQDRVNVFNP